MIMAVGNLQTSFLTPPFDFALFYPHGVAPKEVITWHIYRLAALFVLIYVFGLALLWFFPSIVTLVPSLIPKWSLACDWFLRCAAPFKAG